MSMMQEFKDFAIKGNMVDMAVGIIIGGAFGKIIGSLVNDVILPPIGLAMGGVNFSDLKTTLKAAEEGAEAVTLNYGSFIQSGIDFLILAFCIFMMVKVVNSLKSAEEEEAPAPSAEEVLLTEIRDALKK